MLTVESSQGVISLELLTVFFVAPLACLICYDIAKKNPRANILMTIVATAELYGGEYPRTQPSPGRKIPRLPPHLRG